MLNDFDNELKENHTGYVTEKFVIMVYYLCMWEQERCRFRAAPRDCSFLFSLAIPQLTGHFFTNHSVFYFILNSLTLYQLSAYHSIIPSKFKSNIV